MVKVDERIVWLNQSKIIAAGTPQEIMSDRGLMVANGLKIPHFLT